jgi:prophage regulatory protein
MTQNTFIRLIKKSVVLGQTGYSSSTLYNRINEGAFCPPIALGARGVAYVEYEVQAVLQAMVAGNTKYELQTLVQSLIKQRSKAV